jgi:hypothetical protein
MGWKRRRAWRLAGRSVIIAIVWIAALIGEWFFLDEQVVAAWGVTTLLAILVGSVWARRLRATDEQPLITVRDLRRR